MRIPRVFHRIWVGPDPVPAALEACGETWLRHHPGWELRLWTDDNLPESLCRGEGSERLRLPQERAEILRLELVWRFGGVHVAPDLECRRSLEPLIEGADFFVATRQGRLTGALFGAVAGHAVLGRALAALEPGAAWGTYDPRATGDPLLERLLAGRGGVCVLGLEEHACARAEANPADSTEIRAELSSIEQRLQAARAEAREWRLRCKRAEADLERLQRSRFPLRRR